MAAHARCAWKRERLAARFAEAGEVVEVPTQTAATLDRYGDGDRVVKLSLSGCFAEIACMHPSWSIPTDLNENLKLKKRAEVPLQKAAGTKSWINKRPPEAGSQ